MTLDFDPIRPVWHLHETVGVPTLAPASSPVPLLQGKKLGVINGSSWISLWSNYFGKLILPGVKLINTGNEAVQLNFMRAHQKGEPCPPQMNIDLFVDTPEDLVRALWRGRHPDLLLHHEPGLSPGARRHGAATVCRWCRSTRP